jgi:DNA-binding response OmpR family regulator
MKVLCIDDALDILGVLSLSLKLGWPDAKVLTAGDGNSGLDLFKSEGPDLVMVDLGMPGMDGYEVIRQIRLCSDVPIVILTVRDEDHDIAKGLEVGADDYITKSFSHVELVSRLQAALRRAHYRNGLDQDTIEVNTRQGFGKGKPLTLTTTQHSPVHHFAGDAGNARTYEASLRETQESDSVDDGHLLAVHNDQLWAKSGDGTRSPTIDLTPNNRPICKRIEPIGIGALFIKQRRSTSTTE